jgi:hypothetical protein
MATIQMLQCPCGARFSIYLPKAMQVHMMGGTAEMLKSAEERDEEERASGEVAFARFFTQTDGTGATFWDASQSPVVECSRCGAKFLVRLPSSGEGAVALIEYEEQNTILCVIMGVLKLYPEARQAVVQVLSENKKTSVVMIRQRVLELYPEARQAVEQALRFPGASA